MDWKRIGRTLVCLLVVMVLVINICTVEARAVVIESTAGTLGLIALLILATCGVVFNPQTQQQVEAVGNAFSTYMYQWGTEAEKLEAVESWIDNAIVIKNPDGSERPDWATITVPAAILGGVLNCVVSIISESPPQFDFVSFDGFSGLTVTNSIWGSFASNLHALDFPLLDVLYSCGVNDKVAVLAGDSSFLYGLYFDVDGLLTLAKFQNPYNSFNASYLTMYSLGDLYVSSIRQTSMVFYSYSHAVSYDGYLTSECSYIDWNSVGDGYSYHGQSHLEFPGYHKNSTDAVFSPDKTNVQFSFAYDSVSDDFFARLNKVYHLSSFSIDSSLLDAVYVGDIPSGVLDGTIAADDIVIPQINYGNLVGSGQTTDSAILDTMEQLANGTMTYDQYMDKIQQSQTTDPDPTVDPSEPSAPSIDVPSDSVGNMTPATFWDGLLDVLMTPAQWLLDGIKAIFVPSEDFLTDKFYAIRSEFAFADSIMATVDFFGAGLKDIQTKPPVIYVDLGATTGDYDLGGKVVFMDLSWYEEYKPIGDALISAFLWAILAWRLFLKLPSIIGGMPGDFVMGSMQTIGADRLLPFRKKEYENVRRLNRKV